MKSRRIVLYRLDTALPGVVALGVVVACCLDSEAAADSPCLGDAADGSSPPSFCLGTMMGILKSGIVGK